MIASGWWEEKKGRVWGRGGQSHSVCASASTSDGTNAYSWMLHNRANDILFRHSVIAWLAFEVSLIRCLILSPPLGLKHPHTQCSFFKIRFFKD